MSLFTINSHAVQFEFEGVLVLQLYRFCTAEYSLDLRAGRPTHGCVRIVGVTGYEADDLIQGISRAIELLTARRSLTEARVVDEDGGGAGVVGVDAVDLEVVGGEGALVGVECGDGGEVAAGGEDVVA